MYIDKNVLLKAVDQYLLTLDDTEKDEWWCTQRVGEAVGLRGFMEWLYFQDMAKEQRKKQWEELNKEFGEQK